MAHEAATPVAASSAASGPAAIVPLPPAAVPSLAAVAFPDPVHGWAAGTGAILATVDGGATWTRQYTGRLRITGLDFLDPLHGWAVAGRHLLRTTDGGTVWTAAGEPAVPLSAVDFVSPTDGWGVARSSLYRSADGGLTWQAASLPGPAAAVCFGTAQDGWAAGGDRVYRTTDGGAQWRVAYAAPESSRGAELAADAEWRLICSGPTEVWGLAIAGAAASQQNYLAIHTADGGATWSAPLGQRSPLPAFRFPAHATAIDAYAGPFAETPGGTAVLFAGQCPACALAGASVTVSEDGGRTWAHHSVSALHQDPSAVALPDAGHAWLVATQGGTGRILASTDGGQTWVEQYPPAVTPTLGVDMLAPRFGYGLGTLGDAAAVLRTTDGGAVWTHVGALPGAPPWPRLPDGPAAPAISFWDAESGYAVTPAGGLAVTGDGGATWRPVRVVLSGVNGVAFAGDGRYGCVQAGVQALATSDGGRTWGAAPAGPGGAIGCALRLQADPGSAGLLAGVGARLRGGAATVATVAAPQGAWVLVNGDTLERTVDGGRSWTALTTGGPVRSLSFAGPADGLMITDDGRVLRTADGGTTWAEIAR